MEEMRSFGYICPACGKAVLHSRSVFALNAAAARMECECGKEALTAETDGLRFRLQVPCGVCGGHHQAECAADAVLRGRGIGLACPEKQELCCYIGEDAEVRRAMEGLALRVAKEKASPDEAFTDNVIMYEVLSELKDIAGRGGISCACGSHRYTMQVRRGAVDGLMRKVQAMGEAKVAEEIGVGVPTLRDVVKELMKPGRDLRSDLPAPILRTDVLDMKDLKPGMVLTGTVRNVIDFGVFVDIGVHQDGLVHISQVCNKFIKHPSEVVAVGDVVKVLVLDVDEKKHRISLSMKQVKE